MKDPVAALESAPMSGMQVRAVAVTGILSAVDGYDVLAMTFAAPGVSQAWGAGKAELGIMLSSGLIGMAAGSLLLAPLGDRFGRRPIGLLCLVLMGLGMLMAAFARSVPELATWRVVTGIGIGAMVPIIAPLASEYANARYRRLAMAIMSIGYPIGGTVGGLAAAMLLQHFEWPVVFLFGAALTAVMAVPTYLWLVETPAFLLTRRPADALPRVNAYLQRCGHAPLDALPPAPAVSRKASFAELFAAGRRRDTIVITITNLLFIMTVYYMLSWMPQMVADQGHSPSFATLVSAVACFAGFVACVLLGWFGASIPLHWFAAGTMGGLTAGAILFGFSGPAPLMLVACGALVGTFLYSGILGLYSAIVATFDPDIRTTGVGFVMGVGRAAGAITPALAGWLFAIGAERALVTTVLAMGSLFAALLILTNAKRYAS